MSADQGGGLPPHDADVEQHLLGALFLYDGVFPEASRWITGRDFFFGAHRRVWDACEAMYAKHGRVSLVSLRQTLIDLGMDDEDPEAPDKPSAKTLATDAGNWTASCESHIKAPGWARDLEALAVRRRLIGVAGTIASHGYDHADADEAVRAAYQALGDATVRRVQTGETTIEATTSDLYDRLNAGETGLGLPTGLPRIDRAQKGLRPGELTVLAARTAHGKTALALQVARHVAGTGTSVAILSLEMDAAALTERLVSAEAGVSVRDVLEGHGDRDDLGRIISALGPISGLPITFLVSPASNLADLKQTAGRWADNGLANLLIVDYLQLVTLGGRGGGNRAYEVGAVAQALRDLAQQHRIPVLALAQLNRSIEHRSDPTPVLADLRESGGIEQAADAVWLLHRPALLGGSPDDPSAFVHLAKNRSGPLTHEPLLFDPATTAFRLLDEHH